MMSPLKYVFNVRFVLLTAVILSLLITCGATFWAAHTLKKELLREREENLNVLLAHTAEVLKPLLKFKIKKEIQRVLGELLRFDFVNGARVHWQEPSIYKELRQLDVLLGKDIKEAPPEFEISVGQLKGKIISYPLKEGDETIGFLEIAIDDSPYQKIIQKTVFNFVLTGLLLSLTLVGLIYFYHHLVTRPIVSLANHIERLKEEKREDQLEPFPAIQAPAEIKQLIEAFNRLIVRINQYQERLESTLEQWRLEARRAESASRAKTEFLANVSHEIRTPITSALGMVELLKEGPLTEEQRQQLKNLTIALKNLNELFNQTLDFARFEVGAPEIKEETFDLKGLVEECLALFKPTLSRKGLEGRLILPDRLPLFVGDPGKLKQIIINLLSNAVKFTQEGEISLEVKVLRQTPDFYWTRISVRDTGEGIQPDQLENIFVPFERLEETFERPYAGVGLGLAIAQRLAKILGGKLWAESQGKGHGAAFHLEIPLKLASPKASKELPPKKFTGRVLLAEDNPVNQLYFRKVLEKLGFEVEVASDGFEAFRLAREKEFDLLLLDIRMPGLDGLEVTRRLRQEGYRGVIFALTAHAVSDIEKEAQQAGFDGFLAKPITRKELAQKLAHWLS